MLPARYSSYHISDKLRTLLLLGIQQRPESVDYVHYALIAEAKKVPKLIITLNLFSEINTGSM